ncbi:hypothetical protein DFQ26_008420 [Actinomortierella ambigua]|nr:hypothetical protein DFQ26_008420 [Actinomortierella ambigua]
MSVNNNNNAESAPVSAKTKRRALSDKPAKLLPERNVRTVFGSNPDQFLLNAVKEACYGAFSLPTFDQALQRIKSHFYDRDYDAVFQNPEHLPVYSARYAPSRALCYYHMFLEHPTLLKPLEGGPSTILCIGAGAGSELMGIAAAMVHVAPLTVTTSSTSSTAKTKKSACTGKQEEVSHSKGAHSSSAHASETTEAITDTSKQTESGITGGMTAVDLATDPAPPPPPPAAAPSRSAVEDMESTVDSSTSAPITSVPVSGDDTASNQGRSKVNVNKSTDIDSSLAASVGQQLDLTIPCDTAIAVAPEKKSKVKKPKKHQVKLVIQDYVDWSGILEPMQKVVRDRMNLPKDRLKVETEVNNILDLDPSVLARVAEADLVTFLFVLNELFQDKKRTMLLVAKVVAAMRPGAQLLVADSAGSFSNLKVGERTYMVYMLLDHLKDLEIVYKDDATWYRCPPNATYPLKLENMRHFVRIYKKI